MSQRVQGSNKLYWHPLQLDSSSFFHNLAPGVDNDGTGIVVALAVANALGELKRNVSNSSCLSVLLFFTGREHTT